MRKNDACSSLARSADGATPGAMANEREAWSVLCDGFQAGAAPRRRRRGGCGLPLIGDFFARAPASELASAGT